MAGPGWTLGETALGPVAIAWSERGIAGVQIPESSRAATRSRMARRFPTSREAEPPPEIRAAMARIVDLLAGRAVDFADVVVDLGAASPFERQVYGLARTIRHGATMTYGEVAAALGDARAAREVGAALGRNPVPIIVPCHRVLAAGGRPGGFSAPGGTATKLRLLALEGAAPGGQPDLFSLAG